MSEIEEKVFKVFVRVEILSCFAIFLSIVVRWLTERHSGMPRAFKYMIVPSSEFYPFRFLMPVLVFFPVYP